MLKLIKLLSLGLAFFSLPAGAFSVCGLAPEEASFKTENHLITICLGEASFQMVITYHDGTGYRIIPVEREGNLFRGTNGQNNFIIDENTFVIGTDGEPPIRESVIERQ